MALLNTERAFLDGLRLHQENNLSSAEELYQSQVIEAYLPQMLTEDQIRAEVAAAVAQTGASGPQDMGKVMGILSAQLAGKADGKIIAALVKETLSN